MEVCVGGGGGGVGGAVGGELYLTLHCHHQNDFGIEMGSVARHFNVLLIIVQGKVTRQCA